jgi:hypothetical protein
MALGKHSNNMGGMFGGHSGSQSGGHNIQAQQAQDPSQQTNGANGYYDNSDAFQQQQGYATDMTQQSYADPSGNGGSQASMFDPTAQVSYASDPSQAYYGDPTAQTTYTDQNFGSQQSYTDPSYGTQAYTDQSFNSQSYVDPSYDTTGQSYSNGQTYDDPTVDAAYAADTQQMNDAWQIDEMNTIAANSEEIAETQAECADDMADAEW